MINNKSFIITGGFGFIFSEMVKKLLSQNNRVLVVDKLTYASANKHSNNLIDEFKNVYGQNFEFWKEDINDVKYLPDADYLIHAAAESHVDNSIASQSEFIRTNILGTEHLLQLVKAKSYFNRPRLINISTDEVLGDNLSGYGFNEDAAQFPSSPYSASKACGENLVIGYGRTFDIKWQIIRPTNTYGPLQFCEKLIPKNLRHLERNEKMILYGKGNNKRTWLYKKDLCNAIEIIIENGNENEIYHVSGDIVKTNKDVLNCLWEVFWHCKKFPNFGLFNEEIAVPSFENSIKIVPNRAGEDKLYLLNDDKVRQLGWKSIYTNFEKNIEEIIKIGTLTQW